MVGDGVANPAEERRGRQPLLIEEGPGLEQGARALGEPAERDTGSHVVRSMRRARRPLLGAAAIAVSCLLLLAGRGPPARPPPREGSAARGAPLRQPELRRATNGQLRTTLTVAPATFAVAGLRVDVRAYEGTIPGPTLVVAPGDVLTIQLVNALGPEAGPSPAAALHSQVKLAADGSVPLAHNGLHAPNSTSLHAHGMHVSPRPGADDIYTAIGPGQAGTYRYEVPHNHPLGLFYYHPHLHGSSALQAHGGMAGGILVAARPEAAPLGSLLVVQTWNVAAGTVRNLRWAAEASGSSMLLGLRTGAEAGGGAGAGGGVALTVNGQLEPRAALRVGEWFRVAVLHAGHNDLLLLSIAPAASEGAAGGRAAGAGAEAAARARASWLAAERDPRVLGALDALAASPQPAGVAGPAAAAAGCELLVLARDGVQLNAPRRQEKVLMSPGSRAELLLRCATEGEYALRTDALAPPPPAGAAGGDADGPLRAHVGSGSDVASGLLLTLVALPGGEAGEGVPEGEAGAGPAAGLYASLDLRDQQLPPSARLLVPMMQGKVPVQRPVGGARPSANANASRPYAWYGMLDREYDRSVLRTVARGAVEEWALLNGATLPPATHLPPPVPTQGATASAAIAAGGAPADTNHPFHLHVNHFQVVAIHAPQPPGGDGRAEPWPFGRGSDGGAAAAARLDYEVGDWRDTITVPTPGSVTVRWRADDFSGVSMAHCHIFGHSDTGMSMDFEVQ